MHEIYQKYADMCNNYSANMQSYVKAALGISHKKVSYEAFVFSVFSRNQEKTKPLTWRSVSSEALQSL